jgi:hypothetical protein
MKETIKKIYDQLIKWWICLITKVSKLPSIGQFCIYAVVFVIPVFLMYAFSYQVNAIIILYYILMYLFFLIGFTLIGKK